MAAPAAQAGAPQYRRFFAYMVRRCRCVVGMFSCIRPRGLRMRSYACRSTHDARPNVSAAGGIACKKGGQAGGGRSCAGEAHGGGRARDLLLAWFLRRSRMPARARRLAPRSPRPRSPRHARSPQQSKRKHAKTATTTTATTTHARVGGVGDGGQRDDGQRLHEAHQPARVARAADDGKRHRRAAGGEKQVSSQGGTNGGWGASDELRRRGRSARRGSAAARRVVCWRPRAALTR